MLDLETHGFQRYYWQPTYDFKIEIVKEENVRPVEDPEWPNSPSCFKERYFLKKYYKKDDDAWFEIFRPINWKVSPFGDSDELVDSGKWIRRNN